MYYPLRLDFQPLLSPSSESSSTPKCNVLNHRIRAEISIYSDRNIIKYFCIVFRLSHLAIKPLSKVHTKSSIKTNLVCVFQQHQRWLTTMEASQTIFCPVLVHFPTTRWSRLMYRARNIRRTNRLSDDSLIRFSAPPTRGSPSSTLPKESTSSTDIAVVLHQFCITISPRAHSYGH